jgi:hypothetical protein
MQIAPIAFTEPTLAQSSTFNWTTGTGTPVPNSSVTFSFLPPPGGFFIDPSTAGVYFFNARSILDVS